MPISAEQSLSVFSAVIQLLSCCCWCQTWNGPPVPRCCTGERCCFFGANEVSTLTWQGFGEQKEPRCCFLSLPQFPCGNGGMYEKHRTIPQGVFIPVTYSNKQGANKNRRKREETTVLVLMFSYPSWELCVSCSLVCVNCKVKSQYAVEPAFITFSP